MYSYCRLLYYTETVHYSAKSKFVYSMYMHAYYPYTRCMFMVRRLNEYWMVRRVDLEPPPPGGLGGGRPGGWGGGVVAFRP